MKTKLPTLLFVFFALFIGFESKAQNPEPCELPTYNITASLSPNAVVFDLMQALSNDGYNFMGYPNCGGGISDETECFYSVLVFNEAMIPLGICAMNQWDIVIHPYAQDACCGEHLLPYYMSYQIEGVTMVCEGLLNITINCGHDCGIIDFSDPALSSVSESNGDGTAGPVECIKVCENSSIVAFAPIFGSGFTYTWDVQGGTIGPNGNPEVDVLWGPNGTGNISVTITNTDPNFTPITYSICIDILEGPEALFSSAGSVCLDSPIQFQDLSSPGATNYVWEWGDGLFNTYNAQTNPAHTYTSPNTYDVSLTVFSDILGPEGNVLCTCSNTYTEQVIVDSLVGPDIQCISTLCENDTSSYFTNAGPCGDYIWSVFDANGVDITATIQGQGTSQILVQWGLGPYGTVELEVVGCTPDYCTTPTSVQIPIIPANGSINGPDVVCQGDVISYDLTKWASVDYDWTITGGNLINQEGSVITVQWYSIGTGVIDVTYTSDFLQNLPGNGPNDCTGFATLNVEVKPKFYINPSPLDVCIGETTTFTAYGSLGGVFDWSNTGGIQTPNSSNSVDITWTSSGNHSVTATLNAANPDLYCNSPVTAFVTVHEVAAPTAVTGPIEVCATSPSYIYEVAASQGLNAVWNPMAAIPGGGLPVANPTEGLYTEVTWGAQGGFDLWVKYQMIEAPSCTSDSLLLEVAELTLDPNLIITSPDAPCANETADYTLIGLHPDASIHWTISPTQYGSVVDGQSTNDIKVQWNDIPNSSVNATITATAELCGNQTIYTKVINLNRAIVPVVVGTDFCFGVDGFGMPLTGTVEVTNAGSFMGPLGSFNWGGSYPNTGTINPTSAGDYIVNTTDINGCSSSGGATIGILPAPILNLTTNGPNTLVAGMPGSTEIVAPYNPSYTYSWSPGGATSETITHNWIGGTLPSTYTYTLTITENPSGCTNTESIEIDEIDLGTCVGPCCDLEPYTLSQPTASLSGGYCDTWSFLSSGNSSNVTNIGWDFGDSSSGSSSNPTTHTYAEIGYYNVSVSGQVPNAAGTHSCTVSSDVLVVDVAMIAQFGTEVSCLPTPTDAPQLCLTDETAYLPGTTLNSINLSVSGQGSSNVSPACYGNLTPGSAYTANLTATHSSGCIDDFTQAVTIPGPVIISATPPVLCLEQTADFSATCLGAVSFDWNFDDTSVGASNDALFDGDSPQHSYAQNTFTDLLGGPYNPNVSVVATHANGCQFSDNISLVVNDLPPTETITSLDGDFKFCYDGSEILELIPASPSQVIWWSPDPGTQVGFGTSLTVTSEGEYGVTIFDPLTGCTTSIDPVLVQQWPLVPAFITGPSILCEGECTELLAPTGNYQYEWSSLGLGLLGNAGSIEICANQINGDDFFTLKVFDPVSGCENDYVLQISVKSNPVIIIDTSPDPPCEGAEVTIFVDNYDDINYDYVWTGGQTGQTFTTFSEGVYTVVAIDKITGCKGSATETVHPCPNLCEVATGCYTACDTGKTVCGPLGLSSYQWNYFPPNNGPSTIAGYTRCITMTQEGDYSLTATNIYGCPKTSGLLEMEFISCDSCQFAYADMLDLQLQSLGTSLYSTDIDGDGVNEDVSCCIWAIDPIISSANGAVESLLCMDIFWGDNNVQYNVPFGAPIEHCYTEGCDDYQITVKIKCCADGSNSQGYTATAFCECVPDCYVRNAFWESVSPNPGLNTCEVCFTGTQFLGPDMLFHQNPSYSIIGIGNSVNITENGQYNICVDLAPGNYNVCRTVEGVSDINESCESVHCHDIQVVCCDSTTTDPCVLPENIVFYPEENPITGTCEDGCEWHFCLGGGGVDFEYDDSHCFEWDFDDGTSYSSNTLECAIHCYDQSGIYNVCLTVYCCDDSSQSVQYCETIEVNCGHPCDFNPATVDFEWGSNSTCPNTGCDEVWFCASDFDMDPNTCISWDFGDGNSYNPALPECPIHCYNSPGVYTACLTVYCCEEGTEGPSAYTICHEIVVSCGGGGGCELPEDIVFYPSGSNQSGGALCPDGACEWNFCLGIDFDFSLFNDSHCFTWDYGDGTIQTSNTPECGVHCYQSGSYDVCLTVYCCDNHSQSVQYCETIIVDCDDGCLIDCPEFDAGLGLVSLGTSTDAAGASCCEYGLVPTLLSDTCQINLFDLCINVDWGDGSAPLQNAAFPVGYTHCFPSGGSYQVTMDVFCCADNGETSQVWTFTDNVTCTNGGCDIPEIDFEWGRNSACANTGCDEIWFCATNFIGDDPNVCLSWDFGDGNIYNPSLPDCPIHCYNSAGVYNACLTVYCCEEGPFGPSAYEVCHEVIVSCGCLADCPEFDAGLGLVNLGTSTDASGASCCEYGLVPELLTDSCQINLFDLCINVDWGDGSAPLQNASFPNGYTHCFPSGGAYTVTMDVFCCDDGLESQTWTFTETVTCIGSDCELPADLVFYPEGSNQSGGAFCPDGECEWNFCLGADFDFSSLNDSHCFTWDYGDGTIQSSNTPECGVHCYPSGIYNVCFTVWCCDDPTQYVEYCETITVDCGGGGDVCEFNPAMVDFEWGTNSSCPTTGCDEVWFCASDFDMDPNTCISWDFGDGNSYNPALPECPIHCYNSPGDYSACMTVYCCEEGQLGPSAYTICHTINVSCGELETECTGDYDLDGFIGVIDLLELLGAYGGPCE